MKILLGMSGGLDSTYAADRLRKEGHDVHGVILKMHEYSDVEGALKASKETGVPVEVVDCRDIFEKYVAEYFVSEYAQGRTPNPCTVCNRLVKFQALYELAMSGGYDKFATGHYASLGEAEGRKFILRGADAKKDQSYMLWNLTQEQLEMLYLPIGGMEKSSVREAARESGISSSEKPESQDICFLPDGNYAEFVESRMGKCNTGNFVDENGKVLGIHRGVIHYTIGQRRGLGVALGQRMFVSNIDPVSGNITLLPDGGAFCEGAVLESLNFQALPPQTDGAEITAEIKIRYAAPPVPCNIRFANGKADVKFLSPIKSVTPGQSGVVYSGDKLLLGGSFAG